MKLAAHGSYQIKSDDNILLVDAHGPFNEVTTQAYVQEMYQACNNFAGKTWGILVTFYGNSIFTPDAEQAIIEITRYRMERGMIANASVIINSNTADVQQMQLRRIYQNCNLPFHVFSDIESAKNWLVSYIEDNEMVTS